MIEKTEGKQTCASENLIKQRGRKVSQPWSTRIPGYWGGGRFARSEGATVLVVARLVCADGL